MQTKLCVSTVSIIHLYIYDKYAPANHSLAPIKFATTFNVFIHVCVQIRKADDQHSQIRLNIGYRVTYIHKYAPTQTVFRVAGRQAGTDFN